MNRQETKPSILFVDDEPSLLSGLRRTLRRYRKTWDIQFAAGGQEALDTLQNHDLDVIVSDVRMPHINGARLMEEVVRRYPGIVRFVLSGQAEDENVFKLAVTAHQYFSKPCDVDGLFNTLETIVQHRQQIADPEIVRQITGLSALPSRFDSFHRMRTVLQADNVNMKLLEEIVASDVGLSTRILQLACSSFFTTARMENCSIEQAINTFGVELLRKLMHAEIFSVNGLPCEVPGERVRDRPGEVDDVLSNILKQQGDPAKTESAAQGSCNLAPYFLALIGIDNSPEFSPGFSPEFKRGAVISSQCRTGPGSVHSIPDPSNQG